jgi:hypothetical protein
MGGILAKWPDYFSILRLRKLGLLEGEDEI